MEVTRLKVEKLLNERTGVVEHAEKHEVAFAVPGRAIDLCQHMTKLLLGQIAQYWAEGFLRWNGKNGAA